MKHRRNRSKISDSGEASTETATIKKLNVSFPNLQKVIINKVNMHKKIIIYTVPWTINEKVSLCYRIVYVYMCVCLCTHLKCINQHQTPIFYSSTKLHQVCKAIWPNIDLHSRSQAWSEKKNFQHLVLMNPKA